MNNKLAQIVSPLVHMLYPHVCCGCGSDVLPADNLICLDCFNELPHTNYASQAGNAVEKIFWGRLNISAAYSEFYFTKGTVVRTLIHELKYRNNIEIGMYLGTMMGESILKSNRITNIDYLIPLPLFADKQKKRGYNQAAVICNGMAQLLNVPVITGNLIRREATETQTKKHRSERWENVSESFFVNDRSVLENKNVILVDDVITTGATIEACGAELLKIEELNLTIATVAFASK
ncbi:ComF family protein [soil metagenome]